MFSIRFYRSQEIPMSLDLEKRIKAIEDYLGIIVREKTWKENGWSCPLHMASTYWCNDCHPENNKYVVEKK